MSPSKLPAHAFGLDANWARGHTTAFAEVQRFIMPYTKIPVFRETAGYIEVRQVLSARWFVASRYGLASNHVVRQQDSFEASSGFRLSTHQLIKFGYEYDHYAAGMQDNDNTVGVQFITTLDRSIAMGSPGQ